MFLLSRRYKACSPELRNEVLYKCLFPSLWRKLSDRAGQIIHQGQFIAFTACELSGPVKN